MSDDALQRRITERIAQLSPEDQMRLQGKVQRLLTHRQALLRFPTPGHLSQLHREDFVQTPMLDKLDEAIMMAERGEVSRIIVNTPPQEGKTSRLQDACAWLMLRDPRRRIAFAAYEQSIASQSSMAIRQLVEKHGAGFRGQTQQLDHEDSLGLMLDPDRAQQANWSLADVPGSPNARPGSVVAVGVGSALTGRPADIIVVDDPVKDAKQADSETWRKGVTNWFQSVVLTRLPPRSIVIVVQTRWHEDDLSGWLLAEDAKKPEHEREWLHLNMPAQAMDDDLLGRAPGEYLVSARGRTAADWERTKLAVGTRWWNAMYQGEPAPVEGGSFKVAWFESYRTPTPPPMKFVMTVIDPADNSGDGDEAGIMTGGLGEDGNGYLLEDASGHYTVGGWVRAALFSMFRHEGGRLAYEVSLSRLHVQIKAEFKAIRRQARDLLRAHRQWSTFKTADDWPAEPNRLAVDAVLRDTLDEDADADEVTALTKQLADLWPYVPAVMRLPETGPPVKKIRATGSKAVRAELISPAFESGRFRMAGSFPKLERQMATWLPSQDSPDRMDAVVHLATEMSVMSSDAGVAKPPPDRPGPRVPRRSLEMPSTLRSSM